MVFEILARQREGGGVFWVQERKRTREKGREQEDMQDVGWGIVRLGGGFRHWTNFQHRIDNDFRTIDSASSGCVILVNCKIKIVLCFSIRNDSGRLVKGEALWQPWHHQIWLQGW